MQLIRASEGKRMPWKNGGGSTLELARFPPEGDFGWRVSIADVEASGPFSRFDGYDRQILMLEGNGMELVSASHGTLALRERFVPQAFAGEWDLEGLLTDGPVRDFNLMTRRGQFTGTLESLWLQSARALACPPGGWRLVHVAQGSLAEAGPGDSLLARTPLTLTPQGPARLVIATISG